MNVIVKYLVDNKTFKDSTDNNRAVAIGEVLDVDVERMKILNENQVGRVIDIIVNEKEEEQTSQTEEGAQQGEEYSKEQLEAMTVNELKELAEKQQVELTSAKKADIIEQILLK